MYFKAGLFRNQTTQYTFHLAAERPTILLMHGQAGDYEMLVGATPGAAGLIEVDQVHERKEKQPADRLRKSYPAAHQVWLSQREPVNSPTVG